MEIWDGAIYMICIIVGQETIMDGRLQDLSMAKHQQLMFIIFLYIINLNCVLHFYHLYLGMMNGPMFT